MHNTWKGVFAIKKHHDTIRSRTDGMVKNAGAGIIRNLVSVLINFVSRTVFIYFLGKSYLGINSLYTEILSFLSFTQLGLGSAITFSLYAPIANNDEEKIAQLLALYRKLYTIIAFTILGLGLALVPVLQYVVKSADKISLFNLRLYFIIFLFNTVISYLVAYRKSFVNAKQRGYIITRLETIIDIIIVSLQILVIVVFRNYLAYLLTHSILTLLSCVCQYLYLDKKEPVLKKKPTAPLPREEKKEIFKNAGSLAVHQIASVAVNSTDNIIISSINELGVLTVGVVSNYTMIITHVLNFVTTIFSGVSAGFGNLVASSTKEHYYKTFCDVNFINFWIYGFCSIAFFVLIPPFIVLWIGSEYLIDTTSLLLIVISRYILGQMTIYNHARNAKGRFDKDYWVSIVESIINLVVSIIAAKHLGLVGVYIGTLASKVFYIIFRPVISYKFAYGKSSLDYFRQLITYFSVTCLAGLITFLLTKNILSDVTILNFVIAVAITAVVPNCVFGLLFYKTDVFQSVKTRITGFIFSRFRKN